jgi:formiminotetrahydrofolate cyclodeaminase
LLSSDFQICAYLGLASVQSAIVNVKINIIDEFGETYINEINDKCAEFLKQATEISNRIILNANS